MNDGTYFAIGAAVAAPLAIGSWRAFRCNLALFHTARTTAPLDGLDLTDARVEPTPAPRNWPPIDEVTSPSVAAAYAALADDRAITFALTGEIVAFIGGGALGTSLPYLSNPLIGVWLFLGALVPTSFGIALRTRATRHWEPLAARYRERYTALTTVTLPTPQRRGLLRSLFRR